MPTAAESPPPWARRPSLSRQGVHLLYNPEALDKWIARKVEPCEEGGYKDSQTGEMLSQEDEANFMLYQQRLCGRYRVGEQADRLVHVDRYMPKIADENRAYVMRYPNQVKAMLKKAWKMRKRIRANRKSERKTARHKRSDASASPESDNKAKRREVECAETWNMVGERSAAPVEKEQSASQNTPPHWGDDDDAFENPASALHEDRTSAASGRGARRGDHRTEDAAMDVWRRSPISQRGNRPKRSPASPTGNERSYVNFVPSLSWQVRQVQAHLSRQRNDPSRRSSSDEQWAVSAEGKKFCRSFSVLSFGGSCWLNSPLLSSVTLAKAKHNYDVLTAPRPNTQHP